MKISVEIPKLPDYAPKYMEKIRSDRLWYFAAQQWHRLYYDYIPYDTGMLADTVRIMPGAIEHMMPYARYIYEGHFNFRKDQHPNASREWDKAAEPVQKPKLISAVQAYIDSGRLDLNG